MVMLMLESPAGSGRQMLLYTAVTVVLAVIDIFRNL